MRVINENLSLFIGLDNLTLHEAMERINSNKGGFLIIVNDKNVVQGTLTDGDIRRFLIELGGDVKSILVKNAMNTSFKSTFTVEDSFDLLKDLNFIPIVDAKGHLLEIAISQGSRLHPFVGFNSETFIIAEIGNNHQGDKKLAFEMVDAAIQSGANCVKFQMRDMNTLYRKSDEEDLGTEYTKSLLDRFQLSDLDLYDVLDYVKKKGAIPMCTPFDVISFKKLRNYGLEYFKIASADFTNYELLKEVARYAKLMICSTGMSTESEIITTSNYLKNLGANFILLHCNSTYPTPDKDVNLLYMNNLKKYSRNGIVGYSGHERGWIIAASAVAMGAKVIEKHFTFNNSWEGNDHKVSLLPSDFKIMVESIRRIENSLGNEGSRVISQGELINRENLAKSLIAKNAIKRGNRITRDDIIIRSPGNGLQPNRIEELIGKIAKRDISVMDFFYDSDLGTKIERKSEYSFNMKFGIPVRFHDFKSLIKGTNLELVEFHLSYADLGRDYISSLSLHADLDFVVHAPELFENDHILDLCSPDESYRIKSVNNLQRVILLTKSLKRYFPSTLKPLIIVNFGGWSKNEFLTKEERALRWKLLTKSLSELDQDGIELIAQTMPPFPWHFGGQSFHNLFTDLKEMISFCKSNKLSLCLDVSHSFLYAKYAGVDFYEYIYELRDITKHLHIVDAKGVDQEGLQISSGEIDFFRVGKTFIPLGKRVSFIPEIWQGHKDDGSGFWEALDNLNGLL